MFHTKVVQKIKTHIFMSSNFFVLFFYFFRKSCRLWYNVEKYGVAGRPEMTAWYGPRFAYWITKATNTHAEYVTHYFSTARMVTRTCLNVTFLRALPTVLPYARLHQRSHITFFPSYPIKRHLINYIRWICLPLLLHSADSIITPEHRDRYHATSFN
jgi:hypothetical protein